ncbi:MAG: succinate dehydrogenase, hydrophobic membrane anchor protein [Rhodocyclaceae bacterium]|nr:succinate dehydrogenase, hydrophobic membrane anchor protein [Rhodocyclaceae bacterium]
MNRIVVGAHYGLKDWLVQRVTAVVMALYTLLMIVAVPTAAGGYDGWRALMSHGLIRFASFVFIVCLCYHAWVGVRDIWMDYVKPTAVRLILHALTLLALVGYAGWATQIIWRL